jgi:hypothetical protein
MAMAVLALHTSCKDDDFVEIDTLQVLGEEFYQGEVVNMGMAVQTSNPDNNYYEWQCEAGSFPSLQQGYPVIKWTAPMESGEFMIRCKVTCDGASQTRETKVKVTGLFFDRFAGATLSNWSTGGQLAAIHDGRLETNLSTANTLDSIGSVSRSITGIFPPFSATADVGIAGNSTFEPKYPVTQPPGYPLWDNYMSIGLSGGTPPVADAPTHYIQSLRVDWWPAAHMMNEVRYLSIDGDSAVIRSADFDARLALNVVRRPDATEGIPESQAEYMIFFRTDALKMQPDQTKNVGISIDEEYTIRIFMDKTEVYSFQTASFRALFGQAPFRINSYRYAYPARTMVYLDNLVVNNTAELMY